MSYDLTAIKVATVKTTENNKCWRGQIEIKLLCSVGGNVSGTTIMENSIKFPQSTNDGITI